MRGAVERRPRRERAAARAVELAAELLLDQAEKFFKAHGVEHVFESRLGAVGAVAVIDEHAHHRVGDLAGVLRLDHDAGVAGKIAMPGDAAEAELEPDARAQAEAVVTCTAWKPMSLVSSRTGIMPAPSKPTLNLRGRP